MKNTIVDLKVIKEEVVIQVKEALVETDLLVAFLIDKRL